MISDCLYGSVSLNVLYKNVQLLCPRAMHTNKVSMRVQSGSAKDASRSEQRRVVVRGSKNNRRPVVGRVIGNLGNVTVDVINGTLVTRVHGISLIQVRNAFMPLFT